MVARHDEGAELVNRTPRIIIAIAAQMIVVHHEVALPSIAPPGAGLREHAVRSRAVWSRWPYGSGNVSLAT